MADPSPVTRSQQAIPPPMGSRRAILHRWTTRSQQGLQWGREVGYQAVVAVADGLEVRIYVPSPVDSVHPPVTDPSNYLVQSPSGPVPVESAHVGVAASVVVLTLERPLPPAVQCTVAIAEGTVRGAGGAVAPPATLGFRSPAMKPEVPVVADWLPPDGGTLGAAEPISFSVSTEASPFTVVIWVRFDATGAAELAFDGRAARGRYQVSASQEGGGIRYELRRAGGWPGSPAVVVYAVSAEPEEMPDVY